VRFAARRRRREPGTPAPARERHAIGHLGVAVAGYARILDGEHLWLALPVDAGRPSLWDESAGAAVPAENDLPADHVEHDPAWTSVRWRLSDALPLEDRAELAVVAVPEGAPPVPVRTAETEPESNLRTPTTVDGRWFFGLRLGRGGVLRVVRKRAKDVARLTGVRLDGCTVEIACRVDLPTADHLLFVDGDGAVVARSATRATEPGTVVTRLSPHELPSAPGTYRVVLGSVERHVPVFRQHDDLHLETWSSVLMPTVLQPDLDDVAGRFQLNRYGALRLVCRPGRSPGKLGATA
jgi:hypothetical protein